MSRRLRRSPTLRWYRLGSRPQLLIKSGDPAGNLGENYQLQGCIQRGMPSTVAIFFQSEKIFPSSRNKSLYHYIQQCGSSIILSVSLSIFVFLWVDGEYYLSLQSNSRIFPQQTFGLTIGRASDIQQKEGDATFRFRGKKKFGEERSINHTTPLIYGPKAQDLATDIQTEMFLPLFLYLQP